MAARAPAAGAAAADLPSSRAAQLLLKAALSRRLRTHGNRRRAHKGRRLSQRIDEAAELFERSETLREKALAAHPSLAAVTLPEAGPGKPRTLGR